MKKRTFLLFGLLAMLVLTACGGKSGAQTSTDDATDTSDNSQQTTAEETAQPIGQHHAQITIKDHGTIDIELDGDAAPISVQNFMDLANDGFYDGLTFHRIITGFMMQGGDPLGNAPAARRIPSRASFRRTAWRTSCRTRAVRFRWHAQATRTAHPRSSSSFSRTAPISTVSTPASAM